MAAISHGRPGDEGIWTRGAPLVPAAMSGRGENRRGGAIARSQGNPEPPRKKPKQEEERPPKHPLPGRAPPPSGPKPISTLCCGESCRKAWEAALWTAEGHGILAAAHASRRPTWRCERRAPVYEALPKTRKYASADSPRAAFVHEGVEFCDALHVEGKDACAEGHGHLVAGLSNSREDRFAWITAGLEYALKLSARHNVKSSTQAGEVV